MHALTFVFSVLLTLGIHALRKPLLSFLKEVFSGVSGRSATRKGVSVSPSKELDTIYPVHFIDQAAIVKSSLISYTFRYDHVLDTKRLRDSLALLLGSGDWRKLGGRLRQNKNGKLEIHVPGRFSPERPPFRFSHVEHATTMSSHPLARQLPRKTGDSPSLHEGCHAFRSFSIPSTLPNNVKHYLSTDEPLICLFINSFTDGTLVSITFPHSLSDAMGTAGLLKAWSQSLRDSRADNLDVELGGAWEDAMASVGTPDDLVAKETEFVLESRQTRGFSLITFIARFIWDALIRRNVETKHIYLPACFLSHLRKQAEEGLWPVTHNRGIDGKNKGSGESGCVTFVSDGDLITAWGARMVLSSAPRGYSAAICNVFDIRGRLDVFKSQSPSQSQSKSRSRAYLQNLILPSTTLLTADEAQNLSVGGLAGRIRRSIIEQTGEAQVRSLVRLARDWFTNLGTMPLFVSRDTARVIACTNWSKAQFLEHADFGPAVIVNPAKSQGGCKDDNNKLSVKPVAYWGTTLAVADSPRDTFVVYGKDGDGNYWLHAYLRTETWDLIKMELEQFNAT